MLINVFYSSFGEAQRHSVLPSVKSLYLIHVMEKIRVNYEPYLSNRLSVFQHSDKFGKYF